MSISRKKATLWNYFFLNVGFVITLINGILIVPLYLHYIDSSLYGAWLATGNVLTWITLVDPGVSQIILQRVGYAIGKNDKEALSFIIISGIIISLILFILAVALGLILSLFIARISNIDIKYTTEITVSFRIALWGTALSLLSTSFTCIVLGFQKAKIHGICLNAVNFAAILLNIYLLHLGLKVHALAYTSLFRGAATCAYAIIVTIYLLRKNEIKLKFNFDYFKSFSKIFTYTFSSRLFDTIATNIDLILVSRYLGGNAVAMLDFSRRPIKIVSGLSNNITVSLLPSLSHLFGAGDKEKIRDNVVRIWVVILTISTFIICGFILFSQSLITIWVGSKFWIGNLNNFLLCLSFILIAVGYNLSNITYSMGDIKNNSIINAAKDFVYIICLLFLTKYYGMTGVIISSIIPTIIMLAYYPRKVCEVAFLTKQNIMAILQSKALMCIIIAICTILAFWLNFSVPIIHLILLAAAYTGGFLLLVLSGNGYLRNQLAVMTNNYKFKRN